MNILPIAKIVRIENYHLDGGTLYKSLGGILKKLEDLGFIEKSTDGFFITYANSDFKNTNRNTIVILNNDDCVMQIILGAVLPE